MGERHRGPLPQTGSDADMAGQPQGIDRRVAQVGKDRGAVPVLTREAFAPT
jgi:hypothetical protein